MTQTYQGAKTKEISFPLGGIGTGCIGLAGNGRLLDMEIFGKPNKGSHAGLSHFAVKVEDGDSLLDARVLNGDLPPPYTGGYNRPHFNSYGFGADRSSLAGLPHFTDCIFSGEYPVANLEFVEERFPGKVRMEAWNPFIPLNEDDSSIPGAFFAFDITNTQQKPLTYTIGLTANNLYTQKGGTHTAFSQEGFTGILLENRHLKPEDPGYGDLSIITDAADTSLQLYWYRGNWFDNLATYWKDFTASGGIKQRNYTHKMQVADENYAADDLATLCARISVLPGETKQLRFVLTWSTPNCHNYWNPEQGASCDCGPGGCCPPSDEPTSWKQYYATVFANSKASALYAMGEYDRLYAETMLFHDTLYGSTLPAEVLEAISGNIAIIKSPTCLRLEDGSLYGFEGCHCDSGCCEGSCTHVWNYTYAIPFLFPRLERSMRTLEYRHSMTPDGGMGFRLMLPVGRAPTDFRPCVDGQYGTVMRVLREYKISGDREWLAEIWPQVKHSIEFAWSDKNADQWDRDRDGIMEGRQHHTLDMELFGENAWLSGLYLGGLLAGAELAAVMGEADTEALYRGMYEQGRVYLNRELFNGEYFYQKIDLEDRTQLDRYAEGGRSLQNQDVYSAYWNGEQGEVMYQIGDGCGIDQVLAQWHANLIGMGEIFDREKTRSALGAIYRYNYIPQMREHFNPCRLYCLNDEGGTVICAWPQGKRKPVIPVPYAEETMHGFEYQAACHMLQEGMIEEGLTCVRAVRERYDGEKRNPWNEFECGSNYARSMAAYALLLTYSGFAYDAGKGHIGFSPLVDTGEFRCFWSLDSGWGSVAFSGDAVTISILRGGLTVRTLQLGKDGAAPASVEVDGTAAAFAVENGDIVLATPHQAGESIVVSWR